MARCVVSDMKTIRLLFASVLVAVAPLSTLVAQDEEAAVAEKAAEALPFVADFDPARYLGKWFEVARLPTGMQPAGTLATAEYAATDEPDVVKVTNTALTAAGGKIAAIEGKARIAKGDPPGRLLVSFGPKFPKAPNYHVLHVDEDYQHAVVGVPDRKSLWILSRKVPVPEQKLKELRAIASKAGFDIDKLEVGQWKADPPATK